jgi:hypothetical protein
MPVSASEQAGEHTSTEPPPRHTSAAAAASDSPRWRQWPAHASQQPGTTPALHLRNSGSAATGDIVAVGGAPANPAPASTIAVDAASKSAADAKVAMETVAAAEKATEREVPVAAAAKRGAVATDMAAEATTSAQTTAAPSAATTAAANAATAEDAISSVQSVRERVAAKSGLLLPLPVANDPRMSIRARGAPTPPPPPLLLSDSTRVAIQEAAVERRHAPALLLPRSPPAAGNPPESAEQFSVNAYVPQLPTDRRAVLVTIGCLLLVIAATLQWCHDPQACMRIVFAARGDSKKEDADGSANGSGSFASAATATAHQRVARSNTTAMSVVLLSTAVAHVRPTIGPGSSINDSGWIEENSSALRDQPQQNTNGTS